jgi:hypothetical protein
MTTDAMPSIKEEMTAGALVAEMEAIVRARRAA